jgi:uncharacterized membrane protein (DUF373 family)
MRYYRNIIKNYNIKDSELAEISSVWDLMYKYKIEFASEISTYAKNNFRMPESNSEKVTAEYKIIFEELYEKLFKGQLNNDYINFLIKYSHFNTRYSVNQEMVNGLLSYSRSWIHERIFQNVPDDFKRKSILMSFHKLMDITLDVVTSSYYEEIIKKYSRTFNLKNFVVDISERFSLFMHIILVTILIFLTASATLFFGFDTFRLLSMGAEHMLITSLGSLLIIWVLVELLHTEIQIIKGGQFKISIFVGVALIAFVRDLLILTLKHETGNLTTYFVLASIMVLGIIYWLIAQQERSGIKRSNK